MNSKKFNTRFELVIFSFVVVDSDRCAAEAQNLFFFIFIFYFFYFLEFVWMPDWGSGVSKAWFCCVLYLDFF